MRLNKKEKELINDFFDSDLDIKIIRRRYTAVLVSNAYYIHHPIAGFGSETGRSERCLGDKRGLRIFDNKSELFDTVVHEDDGFESAKEAIEFLGGYSI
jgi:hypothetical protein